MRVEIKKAINTPAEKRTHKQEKLLYDVQWNKNKRRNRRNNQVIAHGKVATTEGMKFVIRR